MAQLTTNQSESLQEVLDQSDAIMNSKEVRSIDRVEEQIISALIDEKNTEKARKICEIHYGSSPNGIE